MKSSAGGGHVAVVGAGFSGTMLAVHLLRQGLKVTLIDRSGRYGEGLAYSTCEAVHLLNVPAANMSAFPDDPRHFARWLEDRGEGNGATFAPRRTYRTYVAEIFQAEGSAANCVHGAAVAIVNGKLRLASGSSIECDAVVIAAGNLEPAPVRRVAEAVPLVDDPWSTEGRAALSKFARQDGDILLVGTGLTMVDTVLSLESQGFGGRVVAISRRGLLPRAHIMSASIDIELPASLRLADLVRWTRSHTGTADWTAVIDALRPITAQIWKSWSGRERSRFLRHLRPWWDVHRHRIAPQIWTQLDALRNSGRLTIRAGRIVGGDGSSVRIRLRGETRAETMRAAGIVNCTGPRGDIRAAADPLFDSLLANAMARTDDFGLGLEVDDRCRVSDRLYAVGPMTRGTFWEVVAVPDIREQVQRLAATIAADLSQGTRSSAWHRPPAARYAG